MAEIRLPLSVTYETDGLTPVEDVIVALQAADIIARDAVSLLPSLIRGLRVEQSSLNVRSLTQESPLREYFLLALIVAFQDDLTEEVPPVLEDLFKITVNDRYDTLVTVVFMIVVFYGISLGIDAIKKAFTDSLPKSKLEELIGVLALETGRPASDIRAIVEAKFDKPTAARRLLSQSKRFFLPSQKSRNAPMRIDRDLIPTEMVREVPHYSGENEEKQDFSRYKPMSAILLELHAQDRDRSAVGWAAVAKNVSEERLKVRVMDPVKPSDLWQKNQVTADIVVVEKLTAHGYLPAEIQITRIIDPVAPPPRQRRSSSAKGKRQ